MLRVESRYFFLSSIIVLIISCQTVPITGRQQLILVPAETVLSMSFTSYRDFLSEHNVITDTEEALMVKRVGLQIQHAVERYFDGRNMSHWLTGYEWEFNLVEDESINAWCMPGGKVVVYTGMIPIAKDDTGMAVVIGHEVAHAVARHGDERLSQGLLAEMGGVALSAALSQKPKETNELFMTAYGLGAQIGFLLPYSRLQESEADRLGMIFMAMGGYDPHGAVDFWKRLTSAKVGVSPPEFLSTHPADETRIRSIEKLIPEAMRYYRK
ncbi:MAG: M48 family metallopeptidase [Nitrospirae bacterium]|nr:M48 family metallopeptidase [Nitrospirota bacterium]